MRLARLLPLMIALATSACVKQGAVRDRPLPDLYHLCNDARTQTFCAPTPSVHPIQVDTNLASPPPANLHALG